MAHIQTTDMLVLANAGKERGASKPSQSDMIDAVSPCHPASPPRSCLAGE